MAVNTGFIDSHKSQHVVNQMNIRLNADWSIIYGVAPIRMAQ